jgi:hypothetical protein
VNRPVIAQGVVTDPGAGHAAGYALVAKSPSLHPEDADTLQTRPEVTDDLHRGPASACYRSFFPLHDGSWALLTRVIRGERRGGYNRVVAHTLVLPPSALEACGWDAFVVLASRFARREPGSGELELDEVVEMAVNATDTLPDLSLHAPDDPEDVRERLLAISLARLGANSAGTEPVRALAWVYSALRAGGRVLLDDSPGGRALLAAAWESLPTADRMRVPWTEHLAPGAEFDYRLACAPQPQELVTAGVLGEHWLLCAESEAQLSTDKAARTLAQRVVDAGDQAAAVTAELEQHRIRVIEGDRLLRWARSADWERRFIPGTTPLSEVLACVAQEGWIDPWVRRRSVLDWIVSDLRERGRNAGASTDAAAAASARELARHRLADLVAPVEIGAAALEPTLVPYASLLALHAWKASPGGAPLRDIATLLAGAPAEDPARRHVARELAGALLRQAPPDGASVVGLGLADHDLSALATTLGEAGGVPEPALLALLEAADTMRESGAQVAAARALLAIWQRIPETDPTRSPALPRVLEVLAAEPGAAAAAFRDLGGARLEGAIAYLSDAIQRGAAHARAVVAAAGSLLGLLRPHRALRGLTRRLLDAGASVNGCMAFALAEAEAVDAVSHASGSPSDELVDGWLSPVTALPAEVAEGVLDALAAAPRSPWGPLRLALFRLGVRGIAAAPWSIVTIVEAVANGDAAALALWDEAVCEAAATLGPSTQGHAVRRIWSLALARRGAIPLSDGARALLPELDRADQHAVAKAWEPRLQVLTARDRPTLQILNAAVSADPRVGFAFQLQDLRSRVESGALETLAALRAANHASVATADPVAEFRGACRVLLPPPPLSAGRTSLVLYASQVLQAMADPGMWPTSRLALRKELPRALDATPLDFLAGVAGRRSARALAFDAARELGTRWKSDVVATLGFVRRVLWRGDVRQFRVFRVASGAEGRPAFPSLEEVAASGTSSISRGRKTIPEP